VHDLLHDGFQLEETYAKLALEHALNTNYVHIKHHPLMKRFQNITNIQMLQEAFEQLNPLESKDNIMR